MLEAECGRCGETFVPTDEDDTIHGVREDGEACGGQGEITGEWVLNSGSPSS
jgi:hypothetical protein